MVKQGPKYSQNTQYIQLGRYIYGCLDATNGEGPVPIGDAFNHLELKVKRPEVQVRHLLNTYYKPYLQVVKNNIGLTSDTDLEILRGYIVGLESRARSSEGRNRRGIE